MKKSGIRSISSIKEDDDIELDRIMNPEDYKFQYKPSIYILFREAALDFRIAAFGVKLAGHSFSLAIRAKYPNGAPIGLSNNLPHFLGKRMSNKWTRIESTVYSQGEIHLRGFDLDYMYMDEADGSDFDALTASIKYNHGMFMYPYNSKEARKILGISKWQQFKWKLKSFFRVW